MDETELRAAIVKEARSWVGTRYHHMGRVKQAGVDCCMLLAEVYPAVLGLGHIEIDYYPPDWSFHRSEERVLELIERWARKIEGPPKPADIALYTVGRRVAHAAIIVEWPAIIHAVPTHGCMPDDAEKQVKLLKKFYAFYRYKEWD